MSSDAWVCDMPLESEADKLRLYTCLGFFASKMYAYTDSPTLQMYMLLDTLAQNATHNTPWYNHVHMPRPIRLSELKGITPGTYTFGLHIEFSNHDYRLRTVAEFDPDLTIGTGPCRCVVRVTDLKEQTKTPSAGSLFISMLKDIYGDFRKSFELQ